ncbi:helix-turn-helix domain-containing protein [Streptomyces sp. FH025]|uniref:helix-turn-helix transcriptional regulator n=1 Tax=Streptomyces sp. FH025 TaxID=2815937 RepID=UPI001A9CB8D6|nr:helix-turn-helix domain-containing protein [Streptomyces sp. FH025]MBO1414394.1 helix-turn-helix domain-containing protein [Streptomyces sp. FH025]
MTDTATLLTAALPDPAARALYLAILREGGRVRAAEVGAEDTAALRRLVEFGPVVPQLVDSSYGAVDPRGVAERIGTEIRKAGARLLAEADQVPELMRELAHAYDAAPQREPIRSGTRIIIGKAEIRHELEQLTHTYPHESLTAQPGATRPADVLAESLVRTRGYLERGGVMRSLVEPAAKLDPTTVRLAAEVARFGCTTRVLAAPFKRFLVFDRSVAIIPAASDYTSAAVVDDPTTVAFVVDTVETFWQQAEGVNWAALSAGSFDTPVHGQIIRLLAQGLTQRAIASRLGLSERTVAGHIARLRELHDAETLFQLGWQMRGARDA